MRLSREEIKAFMVRWGAAWDNHDLDSILEMCHEDILFENWTGAWVRGKEKLRQGWAPWFANHGNFRFTDEDTFIDETEQKVLYRWRLDWPSMENGYEGKAERRRGVDLLHFKDGKVIEKLTYSKTTVEIERERVPLSALRE
ncbi:MAG: nuclear transport factor 2 family protein [Desulfobacteraceae bacterium]|jgi:ketosteroid isomerase-like protein